MKARYKERIRAKFPVVFSDGSQFGEAWVLDVTIPGCLIESRVRVQQGQSLQLKIYLPRLKAPLSVTLAVVRWTNGTQFGVEFIKMENPQRALLDDFMAPHLPDVASKRSAARAFSEPCGQNWHLQTFSMTKKHEESQ